MREQTSLPRRSCRDDFQVPHNVRGNTLHTQHFPPSRRKCLRSMRCIPLHHFLQIVPVHISGNHCCQSLSRWRTFQQDKTGIDRARCLSLSTPRVLLGKPLRSSFAPRRTRRCRCRCHFQALASPFVPVLSAHRRSAHAVNKYRDRCEGIPCRQNRDRIRANKCCTCRLARLDLENTSSDLSADCKLR